MSKDDTDCMGHLLGQRCEDVSAILVDCWYEIRLLTAAELGEEERPDFHDCHTFGEDGRKYLHFTEKHSSLDHVVSVSEIRMVRVQ